MNDGAGEDGFVTWVCRRQPPRADVAIGPGDDAAVWLPSGRPLIVTTDMLLEGSCFRLAEAGAYRVGRKAMAVNLSDIAAMAGVPRVAVVSVGLPRDGGRAIAEELDRGLRERATEFDVALVGGDTNSHDAGLVISVTVVGEATERGAVGRSGADVGDRLFVTGPLGGSIRGHHLDFVPRVREAQALHEFVDLHAMIDISDGLAKDLHRVCAASRCGAVVQADRVPLNPGVELRNALGDGEDFELLFAVSEPDAARLRAASPVPVFEIGYCLDAGVWLEHGDERSPLPPLGYEHGF